MFDLFKKSFLELKKTKTIVICGLLLAISLILNTLTIKVGEIIIISLSFIATSIVGFLFGPVTAGILAGLSDLLGFFLNPIRGTFHPIFTFNAIVGGLLYGMFLYKKSNQDKSLINKIIVCKLLVTVIVSLLLNTLSISIINGTKFSVLIIPRIYKNLIELPIHCIVMYIILKTLNKIYYKLNLEDN